MLAAAKDDLTRRRWIWQAISDLFLDDEVTDETLRNIARVAAECGYSDDELDAIYRQEVAPAVAFNFLDVAGAWGYFDTEWLERRILRSRGCGYWIDRFIWSPWPVWDLRIHWARVKSLLNEERERIGAASATPASHWSSFRTKEAPRLRCGPP